jgi:hypothetical protein
MDAYRKLYEKLELPNLAWKMLSGEVPIDPGPSFVSVGFPPALIPIRWDGAGPDYVGFWRHWFVERHTSIVRVPYWMGWWAYEEARNFDQHVRLLVFDRINIDGGPSPQARALAATLGVPDDEVDNMAEIFRASGHDPAALLVLPVFAADPPLDCFPDGQGYRGDFPNPAMPRDRGTFSRICSFELDDDLYPQIATAAAAPPWVRATRQRPVFEDRLRAGDLAGAWLSLNSRGWDFGELCAAVQALAARANNPEFSILTEAWLSMQPRTGSF